MNVTVDQNLKPSLYFLKHASGLSLDCTLITIFVHRSYHGFMVVTMFHLLINKV